MQLLHESIQGIPRRDCGFPAVAWLWSYCHDDDAMKSKHLSSAQGFSLVELLVVIAVIAIIAAIAIPNIANITSQATVAKDQRNAQNIASVASAARAAGYTTNWGTVTNAVAVLTANQGAGVSIKSGTNFLNFGVSGIGATETGYTNHLTLQTTTTPDTLVYTP